MMVEAIEKPFTYRWPDGEVRLTPGEPIELPADRVKRLLAKAPGRVRVVTPQSDEQELALGDWVTWQDGNGRRGAGTVADADADEYLVVYENGDVNDVVAVHKALILR